MELEISCLFRLGSETEATQIGFTWKLEFLAVSRLGSGIEVAQTCFT